MTAGARFGSAVPQAGAAWLSGAITAVRASTGSVATTTAYRRIY
jgi:hypothetical protein